jgi:hypothetical protein
MTDPRDGTDLMTPYTESEPVPDFRIVSCLRFVSCKFVDRLE